MWRVGAACGRGLKIIQTWISNKVYYVGDVVVGVECVEHKTEK